MQGRGAPKLCHPGADGHRGRGPIRRSRLQRGRARVSAESSRSNVTQAKRPRSVPTSFATILLRLAISTIALLILNARVLRQELKIRNLE